MVNPQALYWREEMRLLATRLSAIGMSEAEVSKQARLLTGVVMEEMQRAYAEKNQPSQKGK